jgi:hypothetical protein
MAAGLWEFARSAVPITVFFDGTDYWLADGFHCVAAAKTAALAEVEVEVRQGTLRDARWFSFGVNAEHGYARSKDDVARILKASSIHSVFQPVSSRIFFTSPSSRVMVSKAA